MPLPPTRLIGSMPLQILPILAALLLCQTGYTAWAAQPDRAGFVVAQELTSGQENIPKSSSAELSDNSGKNRRKIEISFGGSLCPVCLVAFQRKLESTAGIFSAQVEALAKATHSSHPPKRARAVIEFAPDKISVSELVVMIKQNDFQFLKVQDLPLAGSSLKAPGN